MQNKRQNCTSIYFKLHILNSKLKTKDSALGKLLMILNAVAALTAQLNVPKNVSR